MTWVYQAASEPSPPTSQPHGLETERRLTTLEISSKSHGDRITLVERVLWGLIVASYGMAHEKLPRLFDLLETLMRLKP
jgi:hypothetical protein